MVSCSGSRPALYLPQILSTKQRRKFLSYTSGTPSSNRRKRIIVAVTGATGSPIAVNLLQRLRQLDVETHLVVSKWGNATLKYELDSPHNTPEFIDSLASKSYSPYDVSAPISSGSFLTDGMIVVPCSMKTLAGIRMGYDSDLIARAASVVLKERRRLVVVARETPLSSIHLENMLELTRAGAVVFPPVMAFYTKPKSIQELVEQSVTRMIDSLGIDQHGGVGEGSRWEGFPKIRQRGSD
jgi:phenylacrylic acid decarboxylase